MSVARVWEAPRVTKPYTEEQWRDIRSPGPRDRCGARRAATCASRWAASPRSSSLDDPDGAEWNTAALGPNKRRLAARPLSAPEGEVRAERARALRPGQVVSGRAAAALVAELFLAAGRRAHLAEPGALSRTRASTTASTRTRRSASSQASRMRLGLSPAFVFAAFEDAFYYLWRERRLPSNVDPFESRLEDAGERARLARVFEQGLDAAVGLRASGGARCERHAVADRAVVPAARALLSGARRFAARATAAARLACRGLRRADYPYVHSPDPTQAFPPLARHARDPRVSFRDVRRRSQARRCWREMSGTA